LRLSTFFQNKEHDDDDDVDSRFQVEMEEDGGDSIGQSWMDTSSLWFMLHWE